RERLLRHVKKKIDVSVGGLRPSAIAGRFHGPRVLINSIPKAGTHLLEGILEDLPLMRNGGKRTLVLTGQNQTAIERSVSGVRRGEFLTAHIGCNPWTSRCLQNSQTRMLFMVRDPRDVVVSRYRYVAEIDHLHPAHAFMKALPGNRDRLKAAITGIAGKMPSMAETLDEFSGWLNHDSALTIRFEDIIGCRGGGDAAIQRRAIEQISEFVGLQVAPSEIDATLSKSLGKTSSTHRSGKIGSSIDEFDDEVEALYQSSVAVFAARYGYR
ncbi:MAG: sulfotransferase domain-containing protein, partial [Pseudomonadota bacterium]